VSSFFHTQLNYCSHAAAENTITDYYFVSCTIACVSSFQTEATRLKNTGAKVIAVGIGSRVDRTELYHIASPPRSSNVNYLEGSSRSRRSTRIGTNVMFLRSYLSMSYTSVEIHIRDAICATGQ